MNPYRPPSAGKSCALAALFVVACTGGPFLYRNISNTIAENKKIASEKKRAEAIENSVLETKIEAVLGNSRKSVMKNQELFSIVREFDCRQTTKLFLSTNAYVARLVVGNDISSCTYSIEESNIANQKHQKVSIQIPKYLAERYVENHEFKVK